MWNNAEHLVAYLAVPSMGAVLHTLNLRLFPEQLIYIANHAEDQVVILDNSLAVPFSELLPHLTTLRHVVVVGPITDEVRAALEAAPQIEAVHDWDALLAAQPKTFDWPELDERDAAAMCYTSGTTGNPKGVVYSHRSIYLHSMQVAGDGHGLRPGRPAAGGRPDVPRHGLGSALRGVHGRVPR